MDKDVYTKISNATLYIITINCGVIIKWNPGMFHLLVSLGHTGRRVVVGHTLNTLQHVIAKKFKKKKNPIMF